MQGRYGYVKIFWGVLWGDITRQFWNFVKWLGFTRYFHPRSQRIDYGMKCGVCKKVLSREDAR